jgi:glutathione S-transferase
METTIYWYSVSAVVLFLKMLALSAYQGFYRISKSTFVNPEDAGVLNQPPAVAELPQVQRAAKAWLNDLENIPIFLGLGTAYVFIGASPEAATWLFATFTIARILHTLMYLLAWQPWRSITYVVAIVCLLGMSWNIGVILYRLVSF